MDVTNSSTNGTQSSTTSIESFNIFILKFLLFVISSSLFWIGISLAVLIHFIIRYIFTLKKSDSVPKFHDETEDTYGKERFTGFDYIWEHNYDAFWHNNEKNHDFLLDNVEKHDSNDLNVQEELAKLHLKHVKAFEENEKLEPSFSFKFEYQMPRKAKEEKLPNLDELPISNETEVSNETPPSANIQNYQIVSEENLRGFVEPPKTMRVSVEESFKEPKFEEFDTKEENFEFELDKEIIGSLDKVQTETDPEPNLKKETKPKYEVEMKLEFETQIKPESEIELKPESKLEPKLEPESESETKPKLEPEPKPELESESEQLHYEERDIDMNYKRSLSEEFDHESWCENEPKYLHHEETNAKFIQKSPENKHTFNPINEHDGSDNFQFESETPLIKPKRISTSSRSTISSRERYKSRRKIIVSEEFSGFDSDSESSLSDGYSVKDLVVDSDSDWFLSEKGSSKCVHESYINEESTGVAKYTVKFMDDIRDLNESNGKFAYIHNQPDEIVDVWSEDSLKTEIEERKSDEDHKLEEFEGLKETKLEEDSLEKVVGLKETNLEAKISLDVDANDYNEGDFNSYENNSVPMKFEFLDRETNIDSSNYENNNTKLENLDNENPREEPGKVESNFKNQGKEYLEEEEEEENDELESLWEHQDLIEQLKMEIKKAKAIGLPTILEESETPKTTIEDLKPFRFDEKFLREDPMDELHKFYKSYRERMRKFDILNYQKMYAIGFLQLKDPLESMGSQKPILPTITSILSQNLYKRRKSADDPTERFIHELRCDLETVYVGQMCLSWEFLRWQYEKVCEMTESDPFRGHQYNQSAGEFQQFQVLISRFVEDEPFQGHRLPNYVKNRCVLRNLLQVPVIKEDSLKEKSEEQRKGNYAITSEELEDIMEESIRVFWEFVKADKDETPGILKSLMGPQIELQDPSDYAFMMHLHSILQKKEKRLKDHLRTGNCLVKKFKKPKEDRSNQDLFFSHVDIKLVSRVLKMPRIASEQLQWCHKKLEKISFVDRKIRREPSFLLFPC